MLHLFAAVAAAKQQQQTNKHANNSLERVGAENRNFHSYDNNNGILSAVCRDITIQMEFVK